MNLVLRFILLIMSSACFCNYANAYTCTPSATVIEIDAGNVFISSSDTVGTKLSEVITGPTTPVLKCSNTSGINAQILTIGSFGVNGTGTKIDGKVVFPTTIPSVGFAIGARSNGCNTESWAVQTSGNATVIVCKSTTGPLATPLTLTPIVQFYRIDAKSTSSITSQNGSLIGLVSNIINAFSIDDANPTKITLTVSVAQKSCSIVNNSIAVDMGTVRITNNNPGGSSGVIGETKPFNINVNCATKTRPAISITSNNPYIPSFGLFNIDSGTNAATGVGIQILNDDNTAFNMTKPKSLGDVSGLYTLALKAQYFQTGTSVTPGTANGSATFTLTYQ